MAEDEQQQQQQRQGAADGDDEVRSFAALAKKKPKTQQELVAEAYNRKVKALGQAAASRMGPPRNATPVDWDRIVALWNQRNPDVDEAQVWDEMLDKAVQALQDDPSLDRDEVLAEVPILVAEKVFPHRVELIRDSSGETDYEGWARFAEQVEERAAKVRVAPPKPEPLKADAPQVREPAPVPPVPAPEMAGQPPLVPDQGMAPSDPTAPGLPAAAPVPPVMPAGPAAMPAAAPALPMGG